MSCMYFYVFSILKQLHTLRFSPVKCMSSALPKYTSMPLSFFCRQRPWCLATQLSADCSLSEAPHISSAVDIIADTYCMKCSPDSC